MVEIYRKSFRFMRESWIALLIMALLMAAADLVLEGKHSGAGTTVVYLFLLYYFHRHFLFGETFTSFKPAKPAEGVPPLKAGRFILVSLAVLALPFLIAIVAAIKLRAGLTKDQTFVLAMLIFLLLYLLCLSIFGTAMPAAVERDPRYSLRAGMKQTLGMMGRLLLRPGLCNVLLVAATIALAVLEQRMAIHLTPVASFIENTAFTFLGFFSAIVGVATLCHVYRRIVPERVGERSGA